MRKSKLSALGATLSELAKLLRWLPRTRLPLVLGYVLAANLVGAAIVFGFIGLSFPPEDNIELSDIGDRGAQLLFLALLILGGAVSATLNLHYAMPTLIWHQSRRDGPTAQLAKDRALRLPASLLWTYAALWLFGSLFFVAFIARSSIRLALIGAVGSFLGGGCACMLIYLSSEQVLRPITIKAIQEGARARSAGRVSQRLMITWMLAYAVPSLSIFGGSVGYELGILQGPASAFVLPVLILNAMSLSIGLLTARALANGIGRPIRELLSAMRQVARGNFETQTQVNDSGELGELQSGFNTMARQVRERERMHSLLCQFVGTDVAQRALADGVRLGGEERFVAVLFVDLIGSTNIAYKQPATQVMGLLNRFFRTVVDIVGAEGGFINKFQGDAALAIFGAPLELEDFATHALRAARVLQNELELVLGDEEARIGVSAGLVVEGHIGASNRLEYTVIGDAVNEAARLSDLAKSEPVHLLASGRAVELADASEATLWTLGEDVLLRGRGEATQLARPKKN